MLPHVGIPQVPHTLICHIARIAYGDIYAHIAAFWLDSPEHYWHENDNEFRNSVVIFVLFSVQCR